MLRALASYIAPVGWLPEGHKPDLGEVWRHCTRPRRQPSAALLRGCVGVMSDLNLNKNERWLPWKKSRNNLRQMQLMLGLQRAVPELAG